jgi:hypothetical protein
MLIFPCSADKRPLTTRGFKDALEAEFARSIYGDPPSWGAPTGAVNGFWVVDVDPEGLPWLAANEHRIGQPVRIPTPRGGWHLLYAYTQPVRSSAGRLAPGVDTRGDGGYIIWRLPDFNFPALEVAPDWLIPPVEAPREYTAEPTVDKERLAEALETISPDVGYDEWCRVGMALHHEYGGSEAGFQTWLDWSAQGAKFKSIGDVRSHWQSFTPGGGITGLSLLQLEQAAPDDFPVVPIEAATEEAKNVVSLWTAKDLLAPHDSPPYLVDGLLEHGAEASLIGPSQSFKSLWALELGVSVATGAPFFGREAQQGLVMYLCGEGAGSLRHRLQALRYARGLDFSEAPFVVLPRPLALPTPEGVQLVKNHIAEAEKLYERKLALLIIDTYGRYSGGEENAAEDLYRFFRAASACRGSAALLVVHHTGHGDATRGRGTSAWEQAVDTEFVAGIKDGTEIRVFENTKQKDGETCAKQFFILAHARTDSTRVGRAVQSVVLESTIYQDPGPKLSAAEQQCLDALVEGTCEANDRGVKSLVAKGILEVRDGKVYKAGEFSAVS